MARKFWTCPRSGCKYRNENSRSPKCLSCGENSRPKLRVQAHKKTLRDDTYHNVYVPLAAEAHGVTDESCCLCGKPRDQARRHHRDHDHKTGKPRGILCIPCNQLLPHQITLEYARLQVAYLERAENYYLNQQEEAA